MKTGTGQTALACRYIKGLVAGTLPEHLPLTTHPERALKQGNGSEIQQVVITVGGRKLIC